MPTLLIFAKEPRPGRVKTRIAEAIGSEAACRLYRAFVADVAAAFRDFELPTAWWVDGDPGALEPLRELARRERYRQPRGDLGARLAAAFERAFACRPGPVAVIGTDSPLLGPDHARDLFHAVASGPRGSDAALLPAEDGGYVGLALRDPAPEAFASVPWSTDRVAEVTAGNLRRAGRSVALLPPLYDVDTVADLGRLAADLAEAPHLAPATAAALRELGRGAASSRPGAQPDA